MTEGDDLSMYIHEASSQQFLFTSYLSGVIRKHSHCRDYLSHGLQNFITSSTRFALLLYTRVPTGQSTHLLHCHVFIHKPQPFQPPPPTIRYAVPFLHRHSPRFPLHCLEFQFGKRGCLLLSAPNKSTHTTLEREPSRGRGRVFSLSL